MATPAPQRDTTAGTVQTNRLSSPRLLMSLDEVNISPLNKSDISGPGIRRFSYWRALQPFLVLIFHGTDPHVTIAPWAMGAYICMRDN
jgi:hypothetical protein